MQLHCQRYVKRNLQCDDASQGKKKEVGGIDSRYRQVSEDVAIIYDLRVENIGVDCCKSCMCLSRSRFRRAQRSHDITGGIETCRGFSSLSCVRDGGNGSLPRG